jgi:hypothetical protein
MDDIIYSAEEICQALQINIMNLMRHDRRTTLELERQIEIFEINISLVNIIIFDDGRNKGGNVILFFLQFGFAFTIYNVERPNEAIGFNIFVGKIMKHKNSAT